MYLSVLHAGSSECGLQRKIIDLQGIKSNLAS